MSSITIADLPRISREELSSKLRQEPASANAKSSAPIAVVDVRDSDYVGGHILGAKHVPSGTLDYSVPELVRTLKDKKEVVFHCALSQQRGPSAALRYLRERDRLLGIPEKNGKGELSGGMEKGEGKGEGQKVYVLEGGFVKWQEKYGEDKLLTEGYDKELWEFGY